MTDCIFCKIIDGEIPSRIVYEDEKIVAFLDTSQTTPGHTLVVPRKHIENIMEYDEELAQDVFIRLPKLTRALSSFDPKIEGLNVLINNGETAYQTVFHSHIHLIPRYSSTDDFVVEFGDNSEKYSDEELDELLVNIQKKIEE